MATIVEIVSAEKKDGFVISYAKTSDGNLVVQKLPLLENGQPNLKAERLYELASKKLAEQSKVSKQTVSSQPKVEKAKPVQQAKPVPQVQQSAEPVQPIEPVQQPIQQNVDLITTANDVVLVIQRLNPNMDIFLAKNYLNNHAPDRIGIKVDPASIKLPEGCVLENNENGTKLKYGKISIDLCPAMKRNNGDDVFYWRNSYLDGLLLPKNIKDYSMSTNAEEILTALRELNQHDIFRIKDGKVESSMNYDYYEIICPLGIKYAFDKNERKAYLENAAGMKIEVEYSYKMDSALADLTDPATSKYKGRVALRNNYPTEAQKQAVYNSIDNPIEKDEKISDKQFKTNGDLLVEIQNLNPGKKIIVDADASKVSFLDIGLNIQNESDLVLPEGYKVTYDQNTGFGKITNSEGQEINFGKISDDGKSYMKKLNDITFEEKGRLLPRNVEKFEDLIDVPDDKLDAPVEGEYEFSNNGELIMAIQQLNPNMDVAVSRIVNEENPFSNFGISTQNISDLRLPEGYTVSYDEKTGTGKLTNGRRELDFNNLAVNKTVDMRVLPKNLKDLSKYEGVDDLLAALSVLNPSEKFGVENQDMISYVNKMISSDDFISNTIDTTSKANEEKPTILLPPGYRFMGDKIINQAGNMFNLNTVVQEKEENMTIDMPGEPIKQVVSKRAPKDDAEKVFIFKRAMEALFKRKKENKDLGKAV